MFQPRIQFFSAAGAGSHDGPAAGLSVEEACVDEARTDEKLHIGAKDETGPLAMVPGLASVAAPYADGLPFHGTSGASRLTRRHGVMESARLWRASLEQKLTRVDLAPDLAQDIGSRRWFRGLGTMLGLGFCALSLWPDFSPLEAAPATHIDDGVRDEFRSQMIMPLALGGDSGRHMGETSAVMPLQAAPERPRLDLVATLVQGDSFGRMLQRAGVGTREADEVTRLISSAASLSDIEAGTKVDITMGRRPAADAPRPVDMLSFRARFDLQLMLERRDGRLVVVPRPIRVDNTPLRIRGKVGSSLYRSARGAGVPPRAVQQYLRTFNNHTSMDDNLRPGDEFDIIVSYKRAATGEAQSGDLLYAGLERGGKPVLQLVRWGKDGRFYEASGVGEQRSGLVAPVNGRITSRYGRRRHPILGYQRMHSGMDIAARHGTPIHAVTDGVVEFAGRRGGYGNFVRLNHGGGLATGYAHMSRFAVRAGTRVRRGQVIGYVGTTGLSTGPHLHYEMYRNGRTVDPASVKFVTRAELSGAELQAFRARLAELKKVTPGAALDPLHDETAKPEETVPEREIDRLNQPRIVS